MTGRARPHPKPSNRLRCTRKAADRKRAQIARGQELFNTTNPSGKSCRGCHNAANNGSNVNGTLFDIGASRAPYFHNGIAPTLKDVVIHYEVALGFQFTKQERDDLVAFLEAL